MLELEITETEYETTTSIVPFPWRTGEWLNHTATCLGLEISRDGRYLIVKAQNGAYCDHLWLSLAPPRGGVNDRYVEKMKKIVETFGIRGTSDSGRVCIDPDKFEAAKGIIFEFGASGAKDEQGGQMVTDKGQPIVNYSIKSRAPSLLPIQGGDAPEAGQIGGGDGDSDVPF